MHFSIALGVYVVNAFGNVILNISFLLHFREEWINGILFPKLFWPSLRKKCSWDREFFFRNSGLKVQNLHIFEITRSIFLNSERSEQLLKQNTFLTCYWRFLEIEYIWTIKIPIGANDRGVEKYRNKIKTRLISEKKMHSAVQCLV